MLLRKHPQLSALSTSPALSSFSLPHPQPTPPYILLAAPKRRVVDKEALEADAASHFRPPRCHTSRDAKVINTRDAKGINTLGMQK
jgi:hypothetical protein